MPFLKNNTAGIDRTLNRVDHLAFPQKEQEKLIRQPDRDVTGDARRTVALGIGEEVPEVNVGELRSREENTPCRVPQLSGVSGHRVG